MYYTTCHAKLKELSQNIIVSRPGAQAGLGGARGGDDTKSGAQRGPAWTCLLFFISQELSLENSFDRRKNILVLTWARNFVLLFAIVSDKSCEDKTLGVRKPVFVNIEW